MDTLQDPALPNSADRLSLKALVPALVEACPDMYEMACKIARDILVKYGVTDVEPERVYWHRFHAAQSSPKTFTGWEHLFETPKESLTLPQLVIQRFSVHDQDNADLLSADAGFYSAGPEAGIYNETNEVRLHANDVLKEFWAINFADTYKQKVASFWNKHAKTFRTLAKCSFLAKVMEDREGGRLSDDNFRTVIKAVAGNVSWPVTLQMLEDEAPAVDGLRVRLLKIGGFVATDILCILDANDRTLLYVPGEIWGVHNFQTTGELHWWILSQIKDPSDRKRFMAHFQAADHDITEDTSSRTQSKQDWLSLSNPGVNLAALIFREPHLENVGLSHVLDLLFSTWDTNDHHLIEHTQETLDQDAFTFLGQATHARMISDANFMMHSNGELRKKLWIGYLNAFGRIFGPMSAVGWPVALAVVGAGIANVGLQIDQAVNGKTPGARKAAVTGAIFTAIDTLFNAIFIKGSGRLPEIAEAETFIEPEEKLAEAAIARPALPALEEIAPKQVLPAEPEDFLSAFKTQITENTLIDTADPKLQEIIQTPSGKNYIFMRRAGNDGFYQVRYVGQLRGWVIIDPASPYSFYRNVPVRLNEALKWEPVPRAGLRGGMKIFGKWPWGHTVDPLPEIAPQSLAYDVPDASRPALRPVAEGRVDDFPLDAQNDSDRFYTEFKTLRRGLYDDAIAFYADPSLPARPLMPTLKPDLPVGEIFKRLLKNTPGLVIGQAATDNSARKLLIENMKMLSKQKVKTLYLEHLLSDFHQADLNAFHTTGRMPPDLESFLKTLDSDPVEPHSLLELVKSAQKNHIRIQAIDSMASSRFPHMENTSTTSSRKMMNYYSTTAIRADQAARRTHRWVALVNEKRASTINGVAGVSELEGTLALRVEQVSLEPARGITADPGKKVLDFMYQSVALIKSDLRLQLEAAPPALTARSLEEALPRSGMFTVQTESGQSMLIHRSGDGTLVKTPIQREADGVFIIRPQWPPISGRHFDSVQALSEAIKEEGLSLVRVRIDPDVVTGTTPTIGETEAASSTSDSSTISAPAPPSTTADTPLVTSPYDVAPQYRKTLVNAPEHFLPDRVHLTRSNEAFEHFKALRTQLYQDAERFYANLRLPERPPIAPLDPASSAPAIITRLYEEFPALVLGESHSDSGAKQFLIDNMQVLAENGVKTLYLEHLLTDFHQAALDNFARTSVMPRDLELYLISQDTGHITDPSGRHTFLNLVQEANKQGIRVQALDCMASYRLEGFDISDPAARQKMMNFHARTIINADQTTRGSHRWVALMGNSHSNTFEGVAGVSELEGGVGLRIEDVAQGRSSGIGADPGKTFFDHDGAPEGLVKGDLRLQMETPWPIRERTEIDKLLSRPGMYTLKRDLRNPLLVHRSRDNKIFSTPIRSESGRFYIEYPSWPTLNEKRFDSIMALLKALDQRGMTLAGWSTPL